MTSGDAIRSTSALDSLLWDAEHDMMLIVRRLYALEAFVCELDRVTRLKPFRIWNDILWMVVLDSRDMLVIHLASWVKGAGEKNGLLHQLRANCLHELRAARKATARTKDDAHLRRVLDKGHRDALVRLFPSTTAVHATRADWEGLSKRIRQTAQPLVDDRNDNRAHLFERGRIGSVKMLDFNDLRGVVTFLEQTMNDLRLIGTGSTMSYHDMNDADAKTVAEEWVDSVLVGSAYRRELVMERRDREAFYAVLHEAHDALPPEREVLFNDNYEE